MLVDSLIQAAKQPCPIGSDSIAGLYLPKKRFILLVLFKQVFFSFADLHRNICFKLADFFCLSQPFFCLSQQKEKKHLKRTTKKNRYF